VARWIAGDPRPVVMGWPFNGTRRWYLTYRRRHPVAAGGYLAILGQRQAELHRLVFAHGVSVLLVPLFGTELLNRGPAYVEYGLGGLTRLVEAEIYQEMFAAGLRIRFYGDYEEVLDTPTLRPVLEACRDLMSATASGDGPLLMIGLFADTPYRTIARLSVEFAETHARPPDRRELIEAYYGIDLPDLSLFLGFLQPQFFDVPLISTGEEDLYFTLNPSPDLTERQLREILYDHLVTRRTPEVDYGALSEEAQAALVEYNELHSGVTLGIGRIDPLTETWTPLLPETPPDREPAP
jgi:adenosine tuberculosinyltransferase